MWISIFAFNLLYCIVNADVYNTYHGVPATAEEIAEFQQKNIADICTISFNPCNESELRRPDASCNNLDYPSHGMYHTRQWRLLPAEYGENYEPRLTSCGEPFWPARKIRELLIKIGEGINVHLTAAAPYFIEATGTDIASAHDIQNFLTTTPNCCSKDQHSSMCAPNYISPTDSIHRWSGIRCYNNTKPITYQTTGCVANNTVPARITYATTHFDLSMVYNSSGVIYNEIRAFEGGRLKVEVVDGQSYPSDGDAACTIQASSQTGCTRKVPNGLLGSNMFTIWYWRHHNMIADGLAKLNPCWSDEKLFRVAMDINIAYYTHILFYEFFALIFGRENLIRDGILKHRAGFRNIYDKSVPPQMAIEFSYILRWFHLTQHGKQKLYDEHGKYMRTEPMVDYVFGVQYLPFNNTMTGLTHGIYKQPCAAFDDTADPDIADKGLGKSQLSFDILTADLAKGRFYGLPPYIKYLDMCSDYKIKHETYDDLLYLMDSSKIELLKIIYKNVIDVEAMAGIWSEKIMNGTWVTPTVYCILVKQLKKSIITDRYWFENPNRPNPLTKKQMQQITSGSLASLLCAVGDKVTEIQPQAFRVIGPGNLPVSCSKIPKLDLTPWKDDQCNKAE